MNTPTPSQTTSGINVDVRTASGASLVVANLVIWALQTYVFKGSVPATVYAAVYAIVSAAVGVFFTHVALNKMPPSYMSALKQRIRTGKNNPIVLPNNAEGGQSAPNFSSSTYVGRDWNAATAENPIVDDNPTPPIGGAA